LSEDVRRFHKHDISEKYNITCHKNLIFEARKV